MEVDAAKVRARLDAVVSAMKEAGAWEIARPADDAFVDMGAFGARTMAFEQWLRWVFVPRVEELLASGGPWPGSSHVAVRAMREGDTNPLVAELTAALSAFDALFDPEHRRRRAQAAYDDSRAALSAGRHDEALREIRAAIEDEPALPNGRNFAGWVLLHAPERTPAQLDEAAVHFRAAMELAPDDPVPLANLCDALAAAGREADAIAEAERAAAGAPQSRAAGAHNWLGWRLMGKPETHARALEHLERAVGLRPGWGVARANLGKALEIAGRGDEAYFELARALACAGDFDRAFCHERRGAYEGRRGWFRNALASMRAALAEDAKRGGARAAPYAEGIAWIEAQLRAAGVKLPPAGADLSAHRGWQRGCELEMPPGFGASSERGEPLAAEVVEVERLLRAEQWQEAIAALEKLEKADWNLLWDAAGFAERGAQRAKRAGARDAACALMRLVVRAYEGWASGASAGGEGMARMHTVEEKRARLRELERG